MFTSRSLATLLNAVDCCPYGASAGRHHRLRQQFQLSGSMMENAMSRRPLYTPEERLRRDATVWTLIQGILAPIQFLIFLVSLGLVTRFMLTGDGLAAAEFSIVVKTLVLYTIMVTGAIWEREVFGRYLFAPAFFWEDVVSMLVLALHTAYVVALYRGALEPFQLMVLALAAYGTYVVNAAQFVLKLRAARLDTRSARVDAGRGMSVAR